MAWLLLKWILFMGIDEKIHCDEVKVQNSLGLHARPASQLVKLALSFDAEITFEKDGEMVDAKSLMGLLMLSASCGTTLKISARGNDGSSALESIVDLINRKFDEE
jgi:phosphocarrier protein